jgi:hypothetical protein
MKKRLLPAIIVATITFGVFYSPECYAIEEISTPLTKKELKKQKKNREKNKETRE